MLAQEKAVFERERTSFLKFASRKALRVDILIISMSFYFLFTFCSILSILLFFFFSVSVAFCHSFLIARSFVCSSASGGSFFLSFFTFFFSLENRQN
jgi:hypothetical protein